MHDPSRGGTKEFGHEHKVPDVMRCDGELWNVRHAGVRALVRQVQEGTGKLAEKALDLGKAGLFWIAVFVAAKYVLESP